MHIRTSQKNKGFALLLAVLLGSLIISTALGIFNLTYKESIISASGRESEFALYAADSGIECALLYDVGKSPDGGNFSTSTSWNQTHIGNVICNGIHVTDVDPDYAVPEFDGGNAANGQPAFATTTFSYQLPPDTFSQPCVTVSVAKIENPVGSPIQTFIQARGYNTCDTSNPRRVERGLNIKF